MKDANAQSTGIGFTGLLTILFIALKLTGKIAWPWWKVLAPLWLAAIIVPVLIIIYLALLVVSENE